MGELRRKAGNLYVPSVEETLRRRRWQLFGHIARMPPERFPNAVLFSSPPPEWKKMGGGQAKTCGKKVDDDLNRTPGRCTCCRSAEETMCRAWSLVRQGLSGGSRSEGSCDAALSTPKGKWQWQWRSFFSPFFPPVFFEFFFRFFRKHIFPRKMKILPILAIF